jgi:outer membrane protein TolC
VHGQLLPSVELDGQIQHANEPDFVFEKQDTRLIMLSVKLPIYTGGVYRAQARQARREADASREQAVDAERSSREQAIRAWQGYQTAGAQIDAIQAQIAAAKSAYEGVQAQQEVGERTVLDVLDAEQEFLNAQVSLVGAERNRIVAAYGLKAATGSLTAKALQLSARAPAQGK